MTVVVGIEALTVDDDGRLQMPTGDNDWAQWIAAGATRNFCENDPLLDWLALYGEARGLRPDTELPGYRGELSFTNFVQEKGTQFEAGIVHWLEQSFPVTRISHGPPDTRQLALAEKTFVCMKRGDPIIYQAVLRNPQNRTYGICDLLVRSDILAQLYPADLSVEEAALSAPTLAGPWHYRAIEIKFTTLSLLKSGALASDMASYAVQVWLYNEALARLQGFTPSTSYILGRAWKRDKERGRRADERLGRVEHDGRIGARGELIAGLADEAVSWLRQVATEGAKWQLRPTPSHPRLWPNMKFQEDHPWHDVKKKLANELAELTLLPGMSADKRAIAHAAGIVRWDQPGITANALGVSGQVRARQLQAVLEANQATPTNPADAVWPRPIDLADNTWRQAAALEFFVDFETVSSLDDDFNKLPEAGGKALIFQIGCGHFKEGQWQFRQWTTARLSEDEEMRIITEWLEYLDQMRSDARLDWSHMRIVHWSSAETSTFLTAYNSAANRHAEQHWPSLPWFDFLVHVIRAAPVTVHGAFGFGLKAIAKAMHQRGLLHTQWLDGPTDGLGAMVGAWAANAEAIQRDIPMDELPLMQEIAAYNQVDCLAMAEVVIWLRENR